MGDTYIQWISWVEWTAELLAAGLGEENLQSDTHRADPTAAALREAKRLGGINGNLKW